MLFYKFKPYIQNTTRFSAPLGDALEHLQQGVVYLGPIIWFRDWFVEFETQRK